MASCTLIVGVLKYFLFWGFLSTLSFILWGFCPTYGTYFHFCFSLSDHVIAWRECFLSTPVSCDHAIVHLDCTDCWSIKIFSVFGVFVHFEFYPFRLLSYGAFVHFAFLCPPTWSHDENVGCPPLYRDHGIVLLDCFSIKIFSLFGWFCPLWVLSFGAFVHFCFSLSAHVIPWRECWLSTPVSCDHGIVRLNCWSIKIFCLLDGFVRFEFYLLGLLSYGAFVHFCISLSAHVIAWRECWLSTPVSCDHGIVHLDCWNIKIFSLWGGFVRFEFYPLGLLSYGAFVHFAFLCPPTWSHDENVGCPPLYHVIMGSYTLIVGVLKYFLFLDGFVRFEFYPLGLLSYGAFVHFCFSLSAHVIAWRECWLSTPVSCDHGIVHLDCWSIEIFSLWGGFVHFEFYPLRLLSYGAFVHFAFLCPPMWLHDENVGCPPLYHVIMGSYTLIVLVLKYFPFLNGFVRFEFYPLGLLSYGAFVHFCFSLSAHVIGWRECWLSTLVSCDHGIVHLDCWNIKKFSLLGVLSALSFILWGFCPVALLSIFAFLCPPTWSHDENVDCPPLYHVIMGSYTLIVGVLKYFLFLMVLSVLSFILLFLLSYGAFVHFCFSLSAHMIGWQECWLSTPVSCDHLIVHLDCWNIKIFSLFWGFCPM